jgi:hypothetical protein
MCYFVYCCIPLLPDTNPFALNSSSSSSSSSSNINNNNNNNNNNNFALKSYLTDFFFMVALISKDHNLFCLVLTIVTCNLFRCFCIANTLSLHI